MAKRGTDESLDLGRGICIPKCCGFLVYYILVRMTGSKSATHFLNTGTKVDQLERGDDLRYCVSVQESLNKKERRS